MDSPFLRHIRAVHTAVLPGRRLPLTLGGALVGYVEPGFADLLAGFPAFRLLAAEVACDDGHALQTAARLLADAGVLVWRGEAFDVRADPDRPSLARLDRGALPKFGVFASGVHLNGLVRRDGGLHVWVGYRGADRLLDPGKLDHIVAGGVSAGYDPRGTLVKEAEEEAAIPASLTERAVEVGRIAYAMERPEGLRRDRLHCYDLELPEEFEPYSTDHEVERFELWPAARVVERVRETDDFKFNVNLVLIDLFIRHGLLPDDEAAVLREALDRGCV
ncbi:MAG TPA: DUF4743 domain-containing protein [Acidisphaera sp.]|nr:DUF4743 domain-containing protein [Acidisphaera sp.]